MGKKTTGLFCTRCGKEFEPYEDVVVVATAFVDGGHYSDYFVNVSSSSPLVHTLCKKCAGEALSVQDRVGAYPADVWAKHWSHLEEGDP